MTVPNDVPELQSLTHLFRAHHYEAVMHRCEDAAAHGHVSPFWFWYMGMALLLSGQADAAQGAWLDGVMVLVDAEHFADPDEAASDLLETLQKEAHVARSHDQFEAAWILHQACLEFAPDHPDLVLDVLETGVVANPTGDAVADIVTHLMNLAAESVDASEDLWIADRGDRLLSITMQLLAKDSTHTATVDLTAFCLRVLTLNSEQGTVFADHLYRAARTCYERSRLKPAIAYADWSIQLDNSKVERIKDAVSILREGGAQTRPRALELTHHWLSIASDPVSRLQAIETLLALAADATGQDDAVYDAYRTYRALVQDIVTTIQDILATAVHPLPLLLEHLGSVRELMNAGMLILYFEDNPAQFRADRNVIAHAAQLHMEMLVPTVKRPNPSMTPTARPLKIGYLGSTLYRHSVGWLSRWLFHHHHSDRLDVHLYSTTYSPDFVQQALKAEYGDRFHSVPADIGAIANQIADDGIDILVELDSLTSPGNCSVMALKPAPIQVNWLGFDSAGLPAIDYFIADPYVLPEDADTYYHEKIWRLPQTYIAVDGFEVYTPTLRRRDLGIPNAAVVYLSSQAGLKRNRQNARLQLQVLRQVPNSYLLIKSFSASREALSSFFYELAEEVGVEGDRLRFLPDFPSEFTYRANLQLADVVLDTYPYNGATTTLEALWMGLPIVTRVGQQFAARNSYTMLMNVGVSEGIAWSDEEYVEWGVRLGQDEALRRDVVWRLRQSRQSAPLWDAKRFAQEMENAYEHMWHVWRDQAPSHL